MGQEPTTRAATRRGPARSAASRARRGLTIAVALGMLLTGLALVSGSGSASADVARPQSWCDVWTALRPLDGTAAHSVPLPDGTVLSATLVSVTGANCSAADAAVKVQGATLTTPASPIHGHSAVARADVATPSTFGPGSFVVSNVALGSVNLELNFAYDPARGVYTFWHAVGTVLLTINGATVPLIFAGNVYDSNNYTLSVGTPTGGVVIPSFAPDAFSFLGSMTNANGVVSVALSADAPTILFQNLTLKNTHLVLNAGGNQNAHLVVSGTAIFGPSTASLSIDLLVAPDGTVASGGGTASVDLNGTLPDGSVAHLAGTATVNIANQVATLGLQASGQLGGFSLLSSNLSVVLSGNDATLTGSFNLQYPGGAANFNGALTYDGTLARITSVSGSAAANYSGTLPDATPFTVNGSVAVSFTPSGLLHAMLTGSGTVGPWAAANASFDVTGTASSATLNGGVSLTIGGQSLSFTGSVALASSVVTQLDLSAGVSNLTIGDAVITSGTFHLVRTVAGSLELDLNGSVKVGGSTLGGSFVVAVAPDGTLTGLTGSGTVAVDGTSADGPFHVAGTATITFAAGHSSVTLTGSGTVAGVPIASVVLTLTSTGSTVSGSLAADATIGSGSVHVTGNVTIVGGVVTALSLSGTIAGSISGQTLALSGAISLGETGGGHMAVTITGSVTKAGVPALTGSFTIGLGSGGAITSVNGTAALALTGSTPDGLTSKVTGNVTVTASGGAANLTFSGTGNLGSNTVAGVTGTVAGSGSVATLTFTAQVQLGSFGSVTATGSATFGGGTLTALSLNASVNASFASAGQTSPTKLVGSLAIGIVGGKVTASVSGTITNGANTLANAQFTVGGGVAALTATVTIPSKLTASVTGTFYYGTATELAGKKITNKAGASVQALTGDFVLSAPTVAFTPGSGWAFNVAFAASRVGPDTWMTVSGALRLSDDATNNNLTFAGAIDNAGNATLTASGKLALGGNVFTSFSANIAVTPTAASVTGNGCLTGPSSLSACLTIQFSQKNGALDYASISGNGSFALWGFLYNNVGFTLSKSSGSVLTALNVNYSARIFFITLVYVNFNIYFNPNGSCNHVQVLNHSLIIGGLVSLFIAGAC